LAQGMLAPRRMVISTGVVRSHGDVQQRALPAVARIVPRSRLNGFSHSVWLAAAVILWWTWSKEAPGMLLQLPVTTNSQPHLLQLRHRLPGAHMPRLVARAASNQVQLDGSNSRRSVFFLYPCALVASSTAPLAVDAQEQPTQATTTPLDTKAVQRIAYPEWFAGTWASASELFSADAGPGVEVLGSAIPGAPVALAAAKEAVGTSAALRRERRTWRALAGSEASSVVAEEPKSIPVGVMAAARALAGTDPIVSANAACTEMADFALCDWDVSAPGGWQWKLRAAEVKSQLDAGGTFRTTQFFDAKITVGPELSVGLVPAVSITTAYRKVPTSPGTGSYGSGQYFKIGLGVIDKTRPFILQAIETIILLPTTLAKGAPRSGIPLATYKTRLLHSPVTVPEDT